MLDFDDVDIPEDDDLPPDVRAQLEKDFEQWERDREEEEGE